MSCYYFLHGPGTGSCLNLCCDYHSEENQGDDSPAGEIQKCLGIGLEPSDKQWKRTHVNVNFFVFFFLLLWLLGGKWRSVTLPLKTRRKFKEKKQLHLQTCFPLHDVSSESISQIKKSGCFELVILKTTCISFYIRQRPWVVSYFFPTNGQNTCLACCSITNHPDPSRHKRFPEPKSHVKVMVFFNVGGIL